MRNSDDHCVSFYLFPSFSLFLQKRPFETRRVQQLEISAQDMSFFRSNLELTGNPRNNHAFSSVLIVVYGSGCQRFAQKRSENSKNREISNQKWALVDICLWTSFFFSVYVNWEINVSLDLHCIDFGLKCSFLRTEFITCEWFHNWRNHRIWICNSSLLYYLFFQKISVKVSCSCFNHTKINFQRILKGEFEWSQVSFWIK